MARRKTITDAYMARLKEECLKRVRLGRCRMECDAAGARIGFCDEVWKASEK